MQNGVQPSALASPLGQWDTYWCLENTGLCHLLHCGPYMVRRAGFILDAGEGYRRLLGMGDTWPGDNYNRKILLLWDKGKERQKSERGKQVFWFISVTWRYDWANFLKLLRASNEWIQVKNLAQCLAHSKHPIIIKAVLVCLLFLSFKHPLARCIQKKISQSL